MFLAADGRRPDRHGAGRPVRTAARRAGTATTVTPRTLRHAFNTAAPDAEMPRRDLHEAAPHPDPRTTIRYDRARGSLDRHATHIAAASVAGTPGNPRAPGSLPPAGYGSQPEGPGRHGSQTAAST